MTARFSRRGMLSATAAGFLLPRPGWGFENAPLPVLGRQGESPGVDPAYLSNGLLGIRPGRIPIAPAPACVAGFVYRRPEYRVECLSPAPYPLTTDIRINGIHLLENLHRTRLASQKLDMSSGELTTEFTFDGGNEVRAAVQVRQIAPRSVPSLLLQRIELRLSASAPIEISPRIAATDVPGTVLSEEAPYRTSGVDCSMLFQSLGHLSQLGIAVRMICDAEFSKSERSGRYAAAAAAGHVYTFHTIAALVADFYHPEPHLEAIRLVNWGAQIGPDSLTASNRREWRELWKSRVLVDDRDDQRALDASFFYLHASNHRSNWNGMAPFGLSSSRYYMGHSFWDTETMSFLPLLLSAPAVAESLLRFRCRGLDAARKAAALFGYRGGQFPWEAAPLSGAEATPTFAATGWAEQHVVPDVALAFWQYQMAAGDRDFLRDATWPVLRAVAEWIESRGIETERGFEILNIMGPDESQNGLNNNAYVNLGCRLAMKAAVQCAGWMGYPAPASWTRIAKSMFLPRSADGTLTVAESSRQNAFQDVSYLFPFGPDLDRATLERTWKAYRAAAPRGRAEVAFAVAERAALAASMGDRRLAAQLFRTAWKSVWLEPFGMAVEAPGGTDGCFLTNMGALLQAAMVGFTGIRIGETEWNRYEASLPENWSSIEIERIYVQGKEKHLIAKHGEKAEITDV